MAQKVMIKKTDIYLCFYQTEKPIGKKTQFARMIDWFELNNYNITQTAYKRICKFLEQKALILNLYK